MYAALTACGHIGTRTDHIADQQGPQGPYRSVPLRLHRRPPALRPLAHPNVSVLAAKEERHLSRDPSKWASSCDQLTPSDSRLGARLPSTRHIEHALVEVWTFVVLVRRWGIGGAAWNLSSLLAPWNRWWWPTWIWSTCLATWCGPAYEGLCSVTSLNHVAGPTGNTSRTSCPSFTSGFAGTLTKWRAGRRVWHHLQCFGVRRCTRGSPGRLFVSPFEAKGACDMLTMDKLWFVAVSFTSHQSGPLLRPHEEHPGEW